MGFGNTPTEQFIVVIAGKMTANEQRAELQWVLSVALTALFYLFSEEAIAVGEKNKEIKVALEAYCPVSFFTVWIDH